MRSVFQQAVISTMRSWIISLVLVALSALCILIAYHLSRSKKKRAEIAAAVEANKPTGSFASTDYISGGPDVDVFGNTPDYYDPFK
jgi:hypothetical protein